MTKHRSPTASATAAPAGWRSVPWSAAAQATLHCLTGCAIGEVAGMVIGTAAELHNTTTVALSVALAFVFGYALTMRGVMRAGVGLRQALGVALAADTVSITVMEILDNAVMITVPGAMNAGLASPLFYRIMISHGKGHAVVHAYH